MKKRKPYKKRSDLKKINDRVWELCKQIIKKRDNNICQKCGTYIKHGDVNHVISRNCSYLKYDLKNLILLCRGCHIYWWHKEIINASIWFQSKYPNRFDYLMKHQSEYKKWTLYDLIEYEQVLKDILNGMDNE